MTENNVRPNRDDSDYVSILTMDVDFGSDRMIKGAKHLVRIMLSASIARLSYIFCMKRQSRGLVWPIVGAHIVGILIQYGSDESNANPVTGRAHLSIGRTIWHEVAEPSVRSGGFRGTVEPSFDLEQHPTPLRLAAKVIFNAANLHHAIADKLIADVDPLRIAAARRNLDQLCFDEPSAITFYEQDVGAGLADHIRVDTVVMNPPLGTRNNPEFLSVAGQIASGSIFSSTASC